MKIPKNINVFGEKWTARIVKTMERNTRGLALPDKKEILILKSENHAEQVQTFLHEFGHAVSFRVGLDQMVTYSIDQEELHVEAFATAILENKELIIDLLKSLK